MIIMPQYVACESRLRDNSFENVHANGADRGYLSRLRLKIYAIANRVCLFQSMR